MRFSTSRAAAVAAVIGSSLLVGCAKEQHAMPASPVPAVLSDFQAIELAEEHLDRNRVDEPRMVKYVEPTGDGNLVSFRTGFDAGANPPVQTRVVMVGHDGSTRELRSRDER